MRPKALVIVQCNTIAAADASGICGAGEPSSCRRPRSPDGAKRHPGEAEPRRLPAFRFAQWERLLRGVPDPAPAAPTERSEMRGDAWALPLPDVASLSGSGRGRIGNT